MGEVSVDLKDILIIALIFLIVLAILNNILALFAIAIRLLVSPMCLIFVVVVIAAVLLFITKIFK
jgi:hypothetical protein